MRIIPPTLLAAMAALLASMASCAPSQSAIQLAIAQTQIVAIAQTQNAIPAHQPQNPDLGISVEAYQATVAQYGWTDWNPETLRDTGEPFLRQPILPG